MGSEEKGSRAGEIQCPRCKRENDAQEPFCSACGFGLAQTGTLSEERRSHMEDWIGRVINKKYRVESVLGEGGFGTVFKVSLPLFDDRRQLALKLLHPDLSRSERFRRRFLREASMSMDLVHPNAIQVREFDQTEEGDLYLTMDFCNGELLKDVLSREGYLTVNRTVPLILQIVSVLEAAHDREIIHRDLKPDNIFILRSPKFGESAMVGDFGLAKSIDRGNDGTSSDLTQGGIVGTPRYMSPEQARGEPLDGRSDIYSLGLIIFEMLTGEHAPRLEGRGRWGSVAGESPSVARLREAIPPNFAVPDPVLELIARCLEPKPAARFQSARELRDALEILPSYIPTYADGARAGRGVGYAVKWMVASWIVLSVGGYLLLPESQRNSVRKFGSDLVGSLFGAATANSDADQNEKVAVKNGGKSEGQPLDVDPATHDAADTENRTPVDENDGSPASVGSVGRKTSAEHLAKGPDGGERVGAGGTSVDPTTDGSQVGGSETGEDKTDVADTGKPDDGELNATPHPEDGSENAEKPADKRVHPVWGSGPCDWVALATDQDTAWQRIEWSPEASNAGPLVQHSVRARVGAEDEKLGYAITIEREGLAATTEYWSCDRDGVQRTRGKKENRVVDELLLFEGDAPKSAWQSRGWSYFTTAGLVDKEVGAQKLRCLEVTATREIGSQKIERRRYFARSVGEVLWEQRVNGALQLQNVRVLPTTE